MHTKEKCKYEKCGYEGFMKFYAKFYKIFINNESVFRCHYGSECPKCGRWQEWKNQNEHEEDLIKNKFYENNGSR